MTPRFPSLLLSLCLLSFPCLADVAQTVDGLVPKLAAAKVEDRYAPQMELQALTLNAARPGAQKERAALAKVLAARVADTSLPQPARVWLVRQLEYIGGAESVAALTTLLKDSDAELKECARRALEKNSGPAATDSLRVALQRSDDTRWTIGLIQSLGERRDTGSLPAINRALDRPETAFAAACALAKIHNDSAVHELWDAFDQKIPVAADALLDAANRLQTRSDSKRAEAIYARLYTGCADVQRRAAALNGLAKTAPAEAKKLIPEALSAPELKLQEAAVSAARQAYGEGVSAELAELLPKLGASAKLCVLRALDSSAEKQVIAVAAEPDPAVQVAALETLGTIGSGDAVPVLLTAAAGDSSSAQKAAAAALARISGPGADAAIAEAAARGESRPRAAAINALSERNTRTALPALLKYAGESDRAINGSACAALGRMGGDKELAPLAKLALAGTATGADAALQAVAARVQDKAAAAETLIGFTRTAPPERIALLFEALATLGGDEALAAISKSVSSDTGEVQDAAVHALAGWPDFAATKPLLALAAAPDTRTTYAILAIQGVARLVKSAENVPAEARLDAAMAAMKASTRNEEKQLLLSAFASVRDPKAADAIKPFLGDPQLKTQAGLAAMSLSEALLKRDKLAAKALAESVKKANLSADLTRRAEDVLNK